MSMSINREKKGRKKKLVEGLLICTAALSWPYLDTYTSNTIMLYRKKRLDIRNATFLNFDLL